MARVPSSHNFAPELLTRVAQSLEEFGLRDKAGGIYERLGLLDRAMDAYVSGRGYRQAIELAKQVNPAMVTSLHEQWGDWLVSEKKGDGAINHYIEAGAVLKAIDAAIA